VYEVIKHWNQLKVYFQAFFDFCKNLFNKLMEFFKWVLDGIGNFIDWICNSISSLCDSVSQFFSNSIDGWKMAWGDFTSFMSGIGSSIWEGLIGGLETGWDFVFEKVGNMAEGIKNIFKKVLDINSPSRVFKSYGIYTGEGYVEGLDAHEPVITGRFEALGDKIKNLGNVKPNFNLSNAALTGAYNGSSSILKNNAPKQYNFTPNINMQISIADTGAKGTAQLTSELKGMAHTAVKNSMVDEFMADALRL
jgi:hypothetical protein